MASQFLKGIVVEVSGDTSGLQKSLKEVDSSLKNTQYELNATNKLLKLDPTNTELLAQKQTLLKNAIQETSDKLKALNKTKQEFESKGNLTDEQQKQFRELTRAIAETENKLGSLKNQTSGISSSLDDASDSALSFSDILKANVLSSAITTGINALVSGFEKIASSLIDITKSGVEYNATMEGYQTSFTAMLGSAEEAEKAIDKIKDSASASPFDIASLVEANQLLLTTGETADKTQEVINALGDAVAYTGGGNDELTRMAQNLQQIKNVGKASSTDIKQFAMAGINVYGILADYLNTSVENVKDLDISYEDLSNALIQASSEEGQYYGAMERQGETLNGQLTLVTSKWNELTGVIANDTTNALTNNFLPAINEALDSMINWEENGFGSLDEAISIGISDMLLALVDKLPDLVQGGLDMITAICDGLLATDEDGHTALEVGVSKLVEKLSKWVLDNWDKLLAIGVNIASGIIEGMANALASWMEENNLSSTIVYGPNGQVIDTNDYLKSGGFGSLGYGSLASGGFASGGITLNASFNMANTQLNENSAKYLANIMVDEINNKLGGMV